MNKISKRSTQGTESSVPTTEIQHAINMFVGYDICLKAEGNQSQQLP